ALLAVVLIGPLVQPQVALEKELMALSHMLLYQVGKAPALVATWVKGLHIKENCFILPLSRLSILAPIVHSKAKGSHLAAIGESSHLRIPCQTTNQHHFIQIRHVGSLLLTRRAFAVPCSAR